MQSIKVVLIAVACVVIGLVGIAYSGLFNVAASVPHSKPVHWLMTTTANASIEKRAAKIEVPDLSSEMLVKSGINDFNAMCVGCHGAPGIAREAMGQGLNPLPPDLSKSATHMSPAELFWVTKHGIRMTGMPAWGVTHDDEALWPVVALMLKLPTLGASGYQALVAEAKGMGHHGGADGHGQHEHGETGAAADDHENDEQSAEAVPDAASDKAEHDHSTHQH